MFSTRGLAGVGVVLGLSPQEGAALGCGASGEPRRCPRSDETRCSRSDAEASSTRARVRGHGSCVDAPAVRRRRGRCPAEARRQCAVDRAGRPGADQRHRHDGGAGDEREVGRPVVEPAQVAGAARAFGEDADHSPVAEHPQRWSGSRRGRGGTGRAGSARPVAGSPPMRPSYISALVSTCTGPRGEDRQQRPVDHADVVGARRSPGPWPGPARRRWTVHAQRRRGPASAQTGRNVCRSAVPRVLDAARWRAGPGGAAPPVRSRVLLGERHELDDLVDDLVERERRGVEWTAPSAMTSGAVARPESIRSRSSSDSWVAATSEPPSSSGPALGAGGRVGGEIDLDLRLRSHDGADVAALDDDAAGPDHGALEVEQARPHLGHGADRADGGVDVVAADRDGHVDCRRR